MSKLRLALILATSLVATPALASTIVGPLPAGGGGCTTSSGSILGIKFTANVDASLDSFYWHCPSGSRTLTLTNDATSAVLHTVTISCNQNVTPGWTLDQGTTYRLQATSSARAVLSGFCNDPLSYPYSNSEITVTSGKLGAGDAGNFWWGARTIVTSPLVVNDPPTANAAGPYSVDEGSSLALTGAGSSDSDGSIVSYEWDFDGDGQYDDATGVTPVFSAASLDGPTSVTVGLQVTDDDGDTDTTTATVNVQNVAPTPQFLLAAGGDEGVSINFSGSATDPGGDGLSYSWNFLDPSLASVGTATGAAPAFVFPDDGTFTVELTATDDDGAPATISTTVDIDNVAPIITGMPTPTGACEGDLGTFSVSAIDVAADQPFGYAWTITHPLLGLVASGTDASIDITFPDDGTFLAEVTLDDGDGGTVTGSTSYSPCNGVPSIDSLGGPATADEGDVLTFSASASDPSTTDPLTYTWDWGDTTSDAAVDLTGPTHVFGDEGIYTVTLTVDDGDGGSVSDTLSVDVANVAPVITSTAGTSAVEGVEYVYDPVVDEPGDDTLLFTVDAAAPPALSLDPATGHISWTPAAADYGNTFTFTLTVDDGDGGTDDEDLSIEVIFGDADEDDMADSWELDNGLDPTDPTDALDDPDGDGLDNLTEFEGGTDPNSFDGPTPPTLIEPIAGVDVTTDMPTLVLGNATDPQGEPLTYGFAVYEDAGLTILAAEHTGVNEDGSGQTSWELDVALVENTMYWWQAWAADPWTDGPGSAIESFFVNVVEEAPPMPTPFYPVDGETVADANPFLEWVPTDDPEGGDVTYCVTLLAADAVTVLTSACDLPQPIGNGSWTIDITLDEDTAYGWTVEAIDDHGTTEGPSEIAEFFYSTEDGAPEGVVFVSPEDGDLVEVASPPLVATEGIDPEGLPLIYRFEIDLVDTFDSEDLLGADIEETLTGEVTWDLEADDIELAEDETTFARVRAVDAAGIGTPWDVISFHVSADNAPPDVPELIRPALEASLTDTSPVFVVGTVLDIEGEEVSYDLLIARDDALTDIVLTVEGLLEGDGPEGAAGFTSHQPETPLELGAYFWSARAIDESGASSDWADPFPLLIYEVDDPDDDDGPLPQTVDGCDCSTIAARSDSAWLLGLLLLLPLAVRRRR